MKVARQVRQMKAVRRSGELGQSPNPSLDLNPSRTRLEVLQMRPLRAPFHEYHQTCCFLVILLRFLRSLRTLCTRGTFDQAEAGTLRKGSSRGDS
jgi:hypothetical protein